MPISRKSNRSTSSIPTSQTQPITFHLLPIYNQNPKPQTQHLRNTTFVSKAICISLFLQKSLKNL
ncbi:hypothetical protein GBA52_020864 [Prunus armeniaca]|nr:hypothetical protein GBA52_020864 [Prunus armeniaca]